LLKVLLLGSVEPHAPLLKQPAPGQQLFKMMTIENFRRSVVGNYLHFNRVDSYADFSGADQCDGSQPPRDRPSNAAVKFLKSPQFSAANYYDLARSRTYACCFSLEKSDFVWATYANGSAIGKVCVVFDLDKLRLRLNELLNRETTGLEHNGALCLQIFSINYGIVEYIDWESHQANLTRLPNPIIYTYLKDEKFLDEKEFRITLSALGIGNFVLNDGSRLEFPASMQVYFDFGAAIRDGTISQFLCDSESSAELVRSLLCTPSTPFQSPEKS
jgi:hypothetical protein